MEAAQKKVQTGLENVGSPKKWAPEKGAPANGPGIKTCITTKTSTEGGREKDPFLVKSVAAVER